MLISLRQHLTLIILRIAHIFIPTSEIHFPIIRPQNTQTLITHHHTIHVFFYCDYLRTHIDIFEYFNHQVMQFFRRCIMAGRMEEYLRNHKWDMQNIWRFYEELLDSRNGGSEINFKWIGRCRGWVNKLVRVFLETLRRRRKILLGFWVKNI